MWCDSFFCSQRFELNICRRRRAKPSDQLNIHLYPKTIKASPLQRLQYEALPAASSLSQAISTNSRRTKASQSKSRMASAYKRSHRFKEVQPQLSHSQTAKSGVRCASCIQQDPTDKQTTPPLHNYAAIWYIAVLNGTYDILNFTL